MRKPNYDKHPATRLNSGTMYRGWSAVLHALQPSASHPSKRHLLVVECYQGVHHSELIGNLMKLSPQLFLNTATLFKSPEAIEALTRPYVTHDRLFGYRAPLGYNDFFDSHKCRQALDALDRAEGLVVVYGHGAAHLVGKPDTLVYADMARWEIQLRSRRKEIHGLGVDNSHEAPSLHYKRGYFVDWNLCDRLKKQILQRVDFWLDSHTPDDPKLIDRHTMLAGLEKTARKPFRVVPFFDPAPWGGQWMKQVCDLDPAQENYGWCFDCVPEENSLLFDLNGTLFQMPSNNVVFAQSRALLGGPVEARFGTDFPIRFDFLDTMGGSHLSLQVHPTTQYIRDTFGIYYTQDESYYLLDAGKGATVYLGLKTGIDPQAMISALKEAQENQTVFDADAYVNQWPAQKHDHFLIPAGTVHCAGSEAMVLEISATPSLFTFKLWDWGRLGLDGLPRPINIEHGQKVIQWERQTELTRAQLVNQMKPLAQGEGWREERTGLHENEFIETRRHWFSVPVTHHTHGGVNVLNLVEGDEAVVESPTGAFEPFVVHYAETFIVPACVEEYVIRPYGLSEGKEIATLKAYVRFN